MAASKIRIRATRGRVVSYTETLTKHRNDGHKIAEERVLDGSALLERHTSFDKTLRKNGVRPQEE